MTTSNLNFTALSIAKAERELNTSFFEELSFIQTKTAKLNTFVFFLVAGGLAPEETEEKISNAFENEATIIELFGEITIGLTESGFLAKKATQEQKAVAKKQIEDMIKIAKKQLAEQSKNSEATETSQNFGEETKN